MPDKGVRKWHSGHYEIQYYTLYAISKTAAIKNKQTLLFEKKPTPSLE